MEVLRGLIVNHFEQLLQSATVRYDVDVVEPHVWVPERKRLEHWLELMSWLTFGVLVLPVQTKVWFELDASKRRDILPISRSLGNVRAVFALCCCRREPTRTERARTAWYVYNWSICLLSTVTGDDLVVLRKGHLVCALLYVIQRQTQNKAVFVCVCWHPCRILGLPFWGFDCLFCGCGFGCHIVCLSKRASIRHGVFLSDGSCAIGNRVPQIGQQL